MKLIFTCAVLLINFLDAAAQLSAFQVYNINPGGNSYPQYLTPFGSKLFFYANDGNKGWELWSADGIANPAIVQDVNPGNGSIITNQYAQPSCELNGKFYFTADNGVVGSELYVSDGTSVILVQDIEPGATGSYPDNFAVLNGNIFFRATAGGSGTELWQYTPFTSTLTQMKEVNPGADSSVTGNLIIFNNKVYFTARTAAAGNELWYYDPIFDTVIMANDINPGTPSSDPQNLIVYNGKMYFSAAHSATGRELYEYDGINPPVRKTDLSPGFTSGLPSYYAPIICGYNNKVYFNGRDANNEYHMYVYDPANGNSTLAFKTNTAGSSDPLWLMVYGGKLCFSATDASKGTELWFYDGTQATLVADLCAGNNGSSPEVLTGVGSDLYFRATDCGGKGVELFRYNPLLGIQNTRFMANVEVYPNPAQTEAYINIGLEKSETLMVTIRNAEGKTVYTTGMRNYTTGKHKIQINLAEFASGNYIYTISNEANVTCVSGKLVKL